MTPQTPSRLYFQVQNKRLAARLGAAMTQNFGPRVVIRTATVVSQTQISVGGSRYEMDSTGLDVQAGQQLDVKNIGRLAAAEYVPADAWGGRGGSGGGTTAGVTSIGAGDGLVGGGTGGVTLNVGEGPGIDVTADAVGLGGDMVLLYDAGGDPVREYALSAAGLDEALAAAASGDVVWLPAGTITGNHTIPAGVTVRGMGENSVLSGTITNTGTTVNVKVGSVVVLYQKGTAAGLVWDPASNELGIRTNDPGAPLDIYRNNVGAIARLGRYEWYQIDPHSDSTRFDFVLRTATGAGNAIFRITPRGSVASNTTPAAIGIYNTDYVADPTNYESLGLRYFDNIAHIDIVGVGSGVVRRLQIAPMTDPYDNVWAAGINVHPTTGYVTINKTTTPADPLEVSGNIEASGQLQSTVATGTAPLEVASTTVVANLNADMVDGEHAFRLAAVTGIDAKAVATTALYTVPAGKSLVPDHVVVRCTAFTAGTKAVQAVASFGGNAGTFNDYLASQTYTITAGSTFVRDSAEGTALPIYAAGSTFGVSIETGSDATTETWAVDAFGYLV